MTYLLDTHTLIWYFSGSDDLSAHAKSIIEDSRNPIAVHSASFWEIAIKISTGKLDLDVSVFFAEAARQGFDVLVPTSNAVIHVSTLPFPTVGKSTHKNPFDRIIAATVLANPEYRLISCDAVFDLYGIKRVW